jgi:hypothetical protein
MKPGPAIALISGISILHYSIIGYAGFSPGVEFEALMNFSLILLLAWWVLEDAKKQNFHRPYELGAFIILAWPVVLPVYLVASRGWTGIKLFPLFILLFYFPRFSGWAAYYLNTPD